MRRELIEEGKVDPITGMLVSERETNFDIQVKVPVKQTSPTQETQDLRLSTKPKQSFKLDLSKCSNVDDSIRTTVDHEADIHVEF